MIKQREPEYMLDGQVVMLLVLNVWIIKPQVLSFLSIEMGEKGRALYVGAKGPLRIYILMYVWVGSLPKSYVSHKYNLYAYLEFSLCSYSSIILGFFYNSNT